MKIKQHFLVCCIAFFSAVTAGEVAGKPAPEYPTRPLVLVVPYAPGGGADTLARVVAQELAQSLGQSVLVQNRPGGATNIASASVARAEPDGHTLLVVAIAFAANQGLFANPGYNTEEFAPVAQLARIPGVLTVSDRAFADRFETLVEKVRAQPGKVVFATTGVGAGPSLACELMRNKGNLPFLSLPYPGSARLVTDLVGRHVPVACDTVSVQLPFIKRGDVKALAVLGPSRSALLPDVPSIAELGFADAAADGWVGIVAPKGVPDVVVERLNREINAIVSREEIRSKLAQQGFEPMTRSAPDFREWIASEVTRWTELARDAGLKAE